MTGPGPGVDAQGNPVIDPTQNVLDLVEAAIKRQDDLREMEAKHARELADLRAAYDRELRQAESNRIDAIRAVDVGAVNRAAEVAATQAAVLAGQVSATAEAVRTQVAATASAAGAALAAALEPIIKDIQDLRKAQYEAQGVKTQSVETTTRQQFSTGNLLALAGLAVVALIGVINIAMNMR